MLIFLIHGKIPSVYSSVQMDVNPVNGQCMGAIVEDTKQKFATNMNPISRRNRSKTITTWYIPAKLLK